MSRELLTTNLMVRCNPAGDDEYGDLLDSFYQPFRSPIGVFNRLFEQYDMAGRTVQVFLDSGTYTLTNQLVGKLPGQRGARNFRITGSLETPESVVIAPTTGYSFSVDQNAACYIEGLRMDGLQSDGLGAPNTGQDLTAVGRDSTMIWGDKLVFGSTCNPFNDCSVNGTLLIEAGAVGSPFKHLIKRGLVTKTWTAQGTGTFQGATRAWIQLPNLTGIRLFQGVNGAHMTDNPAQYVIGLDVPNSRVWLAHPLAAGVAPQTANFSNGSQCHILAGVNSAVQLVTNGDAGRFEIRLEQAPFFFDAFITAYQGSTVDYPRAAVPYSNAQGKRFRVLENGVITSGWPGFGLTEAQGKLLFPGSMEGEASLGGLYR
jgi:hypothetical protein